MIVLGISGGIGHDCSACIVKDGQVLCAAEEERFSRIKRSSRKPPVYATLFCLKEAGIDINDVDCLAIGWNPDKFKIRWPMDYLEEYLSSPLLKRKKPFEIVTVDHHIAHLIAAYANSGFEKATGIVIDGQGEDCSTTIAYIDNKNVKIIEQNPISQSLGYFYQGVLRYLNLGRSESGKLMGLAAYGQPQYELPVSFDEYGYHVPIKDHKYNFVEESNEYVISWWIKWLNQTLGTAAEGELKTDRLRNRALSRVPFERLNCNLAASAQHYLEEAILATIKRGVQLTNCRNVVYGGGVALNCAANGKIMESGICDKLSLFSAGGDSGTSVGAALFVDGTYEIKAGQYNAYLGPAYSDDEILSAVRELNLNYHVEEYVEEVVSDLLANGKIVGWFQGKMELGPRALGARSILANPSDKNTLDYINNEIKYREAWRPLSPSVLSEFASEYVYNVQESPNMLVAFHAKDIMQAHMGAAVHVDGTTRIQTVSEDNGRYRMLIEKFYEKTGIPGVLNTSFNLDGEPIVCSPFDAIRTFYSSNLDNLVLGNVVIDKSI
ncbi:MAG: hypothetical protein NC225_02160 [Clostridium sp.]|nr:hypothetical protein [Clostridium sp.]MCM1398267.1 hypothetical protein [Clostridium sp.]MCM1459069.1 hypothetical protein [Bacteroides sp.]